MLADIRTLPKCIKEVLRRVGYARNEIEIEKTDKMSLRRVPCLRYNRGFSAIVDLHSGRYRIGVGSFGGSNQCFSTIVDDCDHEFEFPSHIAIVKGEHGDCGNYAKILIHPDGPISVPEVEDEQEDRIYRLLKIYKSTSGKKREKWLIGMHAMDLRDAMKLGLIQIFSNGGAKVTKRGKKYIRKYEASFPHNKIL